METTDFFPSRLVQVSSSQGQIYWPAVCFYKVLLEHYHTLIHLLSVSVFVVHQQNWVAATETTCPTKPKIIICSLQESVPGPGVVVQNMSSWPHLLWESS